MILVSVKIRNQHVGIITLDVKPAKDAKSINQSEYLLFARYNFGNELKGLSISDYFGIQTSPLYEREFIQNRVQLAYDF